VIELICWKFQEKDIIEKFIVNLNIYKEKYIQKDIELIKILINQPISNVFLKAEILKKSIQY
jgi:hypothetical protein